MKFILIFGIGLMGAQSSLAKAVAGAVVTSHQWRVERGTNTIESFRGNVRYHSGPNKIFSDWARFDHNRQQWFFKGHVRASHKEDSGALLKAYGASGDYNQNSQDGNLNPAKNRQILMIRVQPRGLPDRATANHVLWKGESKTVLIGRVHSKGPRLETWSDKTLILDKPLGRSGCSLRRVFLTGQRPVAVKFPQDKKDWRGAVKADTLKTHTPHATGQESSSESGDAFCGPDRFVALGRARGWIIFKNSEKKKKKTPKAKAKKK